MLLAGAALIVLLLGSASVSKPGPAGAAAIAPSAAAVGARLVEPRLSFVPNRGQLDPRAAFSAQGADAGVYFTSTGVRYAFPQRRGRYVLGLDFVGGRSVAPVG